LKANFTNYSDFFVREVGRGSGVLVRCEGEEGDDKDRKRKPVCTYFGKKVRENLYRLSFNEFAMVHRGI